MKNYQDEIWAIVDLISSDEVADAYTKLTEVIKDCEPGSGLTDQLQALEGQLKEFTSFKPTAKGEQFQDNIKEVKKRYKLLRHGMYALMGQYFLHGLRQQTPRMGIVFEKAALVKNDDVAEKLSALLTEEAMLHLQSNLSAEQLAEKECEVQEKLNDYREKVFDSFLVSGVWTLEELRLVESLLLSPITDEVSVQLFVSAITLSCLNFFDPGKYLLLAKVYKHTASTAVKVRALVGLVLCDVFMPRFLEKEGLTKELSDLMASDEKFGDNLLKVQKCLNISVLSVDMCHDIANKMFGGAMKHMGHMAMGETEDERVKRITSNGDEDEADAEMQATVDGVMNHEREGYDLYIGQFKELSRSKFYKKLYNWFMPFDEQNPTILQFMAQMPKGREAMMMMHDHTEFCDSDLYGFVYLAQKFPDMLDNLWHQLPQNFDEELSRGLKHYGESRLLRNYVRQLSRFYMYGNKQLNFVDPFTERLENDYLAYCFMSNTHYEDPLFRNVRAKAKEYAFNQGTGDLLLSFYDKEDPASITIDEHLHIAEVLMESGGEFCENKASEHVQFVLRSEPDNMRAHFLTYFNPLSTDSEIIKSALVVLDNQAKLMAETEEDDEQLTEEDFFDVKIKLMTAYIHTRQLEAALKLAYEMDYNQPGNDRVNACLAYCLLHRNPIMVSPEQIEKVEKIIDPFLAQDLKSVIHDTLLNGLGSNKDPNEIMKSLASVFFTTTQKDLKAECIFEYCKVMCALSRHEEDTAIEYLTRGLINCVSKDGELDDFMWSLIFPYGAEWLSQFGYDEQYVNLLYQRAKIKIMEAGKKMKI